MTNHDDFSSHPKPSRGAVRRRRLLASAAGGTAVLVTAVVTVMTAGLATAAAPTSGQEVTDQPAALDTSGQAPETVLLPTGDRVRMRPDGTIGLLPAEGRDDIGFHAVTAADGSGDTIIVPQDKSDEILSGTEDSRRYNVTQLIADGNTDAADVEASQLESYAGLPPTTDDAGAEAAQTLTVAIKDRSGDVPASSHVTWFDTADPDHNGSLEFDAGGIASADLTPGAYLLTYSFGNDSTDTEPGEEIHGISHVVIEDQSTGLVLDGAEAQPVTVEVERSDATLANDVLALAALAPDGSSVGLTSFGSDATNRYLMPETDLPGYDLGFRYQQTLTGTKGGPYEYNLAFAQHGIPDDTAFRVADDDLAAVETEYRGFGKAVDGFTCKSGDHAVASIGMGVCFLTPTSFPSERLELFTADPAISWSNRVEGGRYDADDNLSDGFREEADLVFEPGETERTFPHGPLAAGGSAMFLYNEDGVTHTENFANLGTSVNGEKVHLLGYTGDATLLRDGLQVDRITGIDPSFGFGFDLTEPAAGRYTLAVDGTRGTAIGPFATTSAVAWTFDLDPTSVGPEGQVLILPAVGVTAEGIDGGWAEDRDQELTLELVDGEGKAVAAEEMTFEVSYNDGRTWKSVDVDQDGSTATVELDHPWYTRYVSTRTTATDASGTEVTQTTIRSYGLR
ncbi:hypothetical protein [Glycomyces tritici]|uniref:Uncharacterized protein n=1 Tax=Glycomyces tritici TaxID=2665176 RepID=A0ABT7YM36_9ACTN|nr:hypothetical protein [Glycomyces tritici]MDN3239691.1 hypothetical protein [Glycomyces tritici]